jgi:exodeoxyribonuclease VII small subunit
MARTATTPAPTPAALTPEPESYEKALAELDALVQQMEGGQMPLDQLLAAYRRGADLLGYCRLRLQSVEDQVKVFDDGQLKAWGGA